MLSSIHPLGERGRNNRWGTTVAAFTTGALISGAALGAILGYSGSLLSVSVDPDTTLALIGALAVASAALDIIRISPPSPTRQVNEHWIGYYRGWVYGAGFGAQLGLGVVTYVVTWTVYATLLAELVIGSALGGAVVGGVFGLGRSIPLFVAGRVRRPSELRSFHRMMAKFGPPVRRVVSYAAGAAGMMVIMGVVS